MTSAKQTLAFAVALILSLSTRGNAWEVWKCSVKYPFLNHPNEDWELDILSPAEIANMYPQKPGRFLYWRPLGGDLLETFLIRENSSGMLRATMDIEHLDINGSLHAEIVVDKHSGKIRTKGGQGGHIRRLLEGTCDLPRH